jgi:hypothetical protein
MLIAALLVPGLVVLTTATLLWLLLRSRTSESPRDSVGVLAHLGCAGHRDARRAASVDQVGTIPAFVPGGLVRPVPARSPWRGSHGP